MRKLADYAFMIRDYKFAHTIYDTVRRDYATDKAYKYHAGTQVKTSALKKLRLLISKTGNDWCLSTDDESAVAQQSRRRS